ncbi:MAG: DNA (cytosine-5-)-methyltransferase [Cetobacterium sp.]
MNIILKLIEEKSLEIEDFDKYFEEILKSYDEYFEKNNIVEKRINGIYHTPYIIAKKIVRETIDPNDNLEKKNFFEPCSGLGSFVFAYLEIVFENLKNINLKKIREIEKKIYIAEWDQEALIFLVAIYKIFLNKKYNLEYPYEKTNFKIANEPVIYNKNLESISLDETFGEEVKKMDYIITNPPYYTLRYVDREKYSINEKKSIITHTEEISKLVKEKNYLYIGFKNLNLYEVFVEEIIERYSDENSKIGLLIPFSFLTNKSTTNMRKRLFEKYTVKTIQPISEKTDFYPVGQTMTILVVNKKRNSDSKIKIKNWIKEKTDINSTKFKYLEIATLQKVTSDWTYVDLDDVSIKILEKLHKNKRIKDHESITNRRGEIDVTKYKNLILKIKNDENTYPLVKGKDLNLYSKPDYNNHVIINDENKRNLISNFRIACNQISNLNMKDRLKFSLIKEKALANSCNYILSEDYNELMYLLGVLNSSLLEWRFRITNGNNHISNYEIDELPINLEKDNLYFSIVEAVSNYLETQKEDLIFEIDELVFRKYNLNYSEKSYVRNYFGINYTYNHYLQKLSEFDMEIINAIPNEGDNWKVLPDSIINKSERLKKIKESGGRTTLYSRLRGDKPSYTMNTYFNRPGNGAHIHPKKNRVITAREAARFQSFPDAYRFMGGKGAILNQIGNAIPPLLVHSLIEKIKESLPIETAVDLFCGAGGSKVGSTMSGIKTFAANDFDAYACETYKYNNPEVNVIHGDITNEKIKQEIINSVGKNKLDLIIGGPPCQGFSLAGKRDIEDDRNKLFLHFAELVKKMKPKILIMENVPGILSMEKGKVFEEIKKSFRELEYSIFAKKLLAADYGVPQLRERVFLVGIRNDIQMNINFSEESIYPQPYLQSGAGATLFDNKNNYIGVNEAINDLEDPVLETNKILLESKKVENLSDYQKFMKGYLSASKYLEIIKK